jgi:hypothetical protein
MSASGVVSRQQHRRIAVVIGVEGRAHHRLLENDAW